MSNLDQKLFFCHHCQQSFTRKHGLVKHLSLKRCPTLKPGSKVTPPPPSSVPALSVPLSLPSPPPKLGQLEQVIADLIKQVAELRHSTGHEVSDLRSNMKQLKDRKPNQLQVVCLGDNDNYLEILGQQWTFQLALDFVKNCALSRLAGDCRLLERIYLSSDQPTIVYANRSRTRFAYFDEEKNQMVESTGKVLMRKLAGNIQSSYMDSVKCFTNVNGDLPREHLATEPLDAYDLEIWHQHIYELSDESYQTKLLNSLNIPFQGDVILPSRIDLPTTINS